MAKDKIREVGVRGEGRRAYRYCGDGAGIAGLPHEVTDEEARALGMLDVLQAALKNGSYQEVGAANPAQEE